MKLDLDKLPDDPKFLQQLVRELVGTLNSQNQRLLELEQQLRVLRRSHFGRSSERFDEGQGRLGFFPQEEGATPPSAEDKPKPSPQQKGHGRRKTPSNLPNQNVQVPLPEDRMTCKHCNTRLVEIGKEVTTQLDYRPAVFHIISFERSKCACPNCHGSLEVADVPYQPIERGMPGPGLLAHILTSKYADHIPLQRLKRIFKRSGLDLNATTMCGWIAAVVGLLKPLYHEMRSSLLRSRVVSADATGLTVRNGNKKGRQSGHLWAYLGDDEHPHVVFDYTATHNRDGPASFLRGYKGYLQVDAHPVYDRLFASGEIVEVGCNAHARRRFVNALETDRERSEAAIKYFKGLYEIEGKASDDECSNDERYQRRQSQAVPLLGTFKEWLRREQLNVLPKSPIGDAIGYTLKHWNALCRYVDDGALHIDNNHTERTLRGPVLGRKNYMFAGSEGGAENAAVLYSFVESCIRNGVDPFEYFRDVLIRIDTHPANKTYELLPGNWKTLVEETGLATLPYEDDPASAT